MSKKYIKSRISNRRKLWIALGIIFGVIMIVGTVASTMSSRFGGIPNTSQNQNSQAASALIQKLSNPTTPNAPPLGSSNAPVTLVEFGDYQCTYCHRFHTDTKDLIVTNLVNTGKVKFLFRDFPTYDLPSDRASTLASEASYCAADEGKYWQYHDQVYNNWQGENTGWVTKVSLKQFANNVGIKDINRFSHCLESGKYAAVVSGNFNLAQSIGMTATPTFVLLANKGNEQPLEIVGAQPYGVFEGAVNQMISAG
jgi:protein-disulfide isomerase